MTLRKNQLEAIQKSIDNDFSSGIHYHATGTGKSWIAMNIVNEFRKKNPKGNVLWLCERKDILNQQFSRNTIVDCGFKEILKGFNLLDYVSKKNANWYESLNASAFWGLPFLCIINRCFLTSKNKYENIKRKIDLVIHDECHSIENSTTLAFYKWLSEHSSNAKVIGFSATPEYIKPLNNLISSYSIYNAFCDNVILPPRIVWVKSEDSIKDDDILFILKMEMEKLPYKKIIIWCGTVDDCIALREKWDCHFPDYIKAVDYNNCENNSFYTFYKAEKKALLFCAVKHREGSDIPNLDGCVFMDKVEKRSERVFIQSMGRVLRLDKERKKTYGLVFDVRAKSSIEICNRVQYYLKLKDIFPWSYDLNSVRHNRKVYYVNSLKMKIAEPIKNSTLDCNYDHDEIRYNESDVMSLFVRKIPLDNPEYEDRLKKEITLILEKNLFGNIMRAMEILELTKGIPHVTRGSCGSSLVCYLLGISHVDPVKYNISFARFINTYRTTLPDIDFDFPHYLRDEVFLKLFQKWGSKVARISNHNYYHEKSSLRESLRRNGVHEFISKYELQKKIDSFDKDFQDQIYDTQKELEGSFRGYSLHCGGIIYFPNGVPREYILDESDKKIIPQVHLNKHNVAEQKSFKIDILSSRGLSQLYYCRHFNDIDFNQHIGDESTIQLLASGNNVGITLAETPLMKKALILIQPKTIMELAICLAVIRPAAKDAKKEFEMGKYRKNTMIFDDDIIQLLAKLFKCDEELADKFRRGYCKDDKETHALIDKKLAPRPKSSQTRIRNILSNLRKYGFCKAHALSYAQLVWQLAYEKAHNTKTFWVSTLKNTKSCYRKWVHLFEARCEGVTKDVTKHDQSLYARQREHDYSGYKPIEQLRNCGYWYGDTFYNGCYYVKRGELYLFNGVVASSRLVKRGKQAMLILCLGIDTKRFIEVLVMGKTSYNTKKVIAQGRGLIKRECEFFPSIECKAKNMLFI